MPQFRHVINAVDKYAANAKKPINWHPGHMYSGMQQIIGKLNTVDCVVEVHDARIPFIGRNEEFKKHLGAIKPRILVLNKSDLADLTDWKSVKQKLEKYGDKHILLTDSSGSAVGRKYRGYNHLLEKVIQIINESDRHNRTMIGFFKIMIVGIPNVGKSTLINRLRQHHLGRRGEPAEVGAAAGVTKVVHNMIKICARPPIYSLDTPGILEPHVTKKEHQAVPLALCASINDKALNPIDLTNYLLRYLNSTLNTGYMNYYFFDDPVSNLQELVDRIVDSHERYSDKVTTNTDCPRPVTVRKASIDKICWDFIRNFRNGKFGKIMFD